MEDQEIIQRYINNFRRHFARFLKPGIGLTFRIIPSKKEGAILEFEVGPNMKNEDHYLPSEQNVNSALKKIRQHMFGGNIDAIKFGGTNIAMEPNRIILIKGEDTPAVWGDDAAIDDITRIMEPPRIVASPRREQ